MSLLTRDITNLRADARNRLRPDLSEEVLDHAMNQEVDALKQTFALYGVPYNEDTVKAANATLIWATKASQEMFLNNIPPHIEHSPLSYAIHGGLVAMNVTFKALDQLEE